MYACQKSQSSIRGLLTTTDTTLQRDGLVSLRRYGEERAHAVLGIWCFHSVDGNIGCSPGLLPFSLLSTLPYLGDAVRGLWRCHQSAVYLSRVR